MSTQTKDSVGIQATSQINYFVIRDRKFGALELMVNGEIKHVIVAQIAQPGVEVLPTTKAADEAPIRKRYREKGYYGPITLDTSAFYEMVD